MKIFSCHFPEGPNKKRERENRKKSTKSRGNFFFSFLPPPFSITKVLFERWADRQTLDSQVLLFSANFRFPLPFFKGKGSAVPFFLLRKVQQCPIPPKKTKEGTKISPKGSAKRKLISLGKGKLCSTFEGGNSNSVYSDRNHLS